MSENHLQRVQDPRPRRILTFQQGLKHNREDTGVALGGVTLGLLHSLDLNHSSVLVRDLKMALL